MKAIEALALVSGHVDDELLKRNEYLAAENEVLRSKITGRIRFTDNERIRLAKLGHELDRKALEGVAAIVKPETILEWFRRLVAQKFDSSRSPRKPGRPRTPEEIEELISKIARKNPSWGYSRIVFPQRDHASDDGEVECQERLGGLLKFYPCSAKNSIVPERLIFLAGDSKVSQDARDVQNTPLDAARGNTLTD